MSDTQAPAPILVVTCLICGHEMKQSRRIAEVVHLYTPKSMCQLIQYHCTTPDCDNEVIVEDR